MPGKLKPPKKCLTRYVITSSMPTMEETLGMQPLICSLIHRGMKSPHEYR